MSSLVEDLNNDGFDDLIFWNLIIDKIGQMQMRAIFF